jgi:hypothetical protein
VPQKCGMQALRVLPLTSLPVWMPSCPLPPVLYTQHTDYHMQLGFTGAILLVTRPIAAQLIAHPALQPGLAAGTFFIILWVGDILVEGCCCCAAALHHHSSAVLRAHLSHSCCTCGRRSCNTQHAEGLLHAGHVHVHVPLM